ncbi:4Fe-4S dicluster domain-containing protein [Methylocystis sp. JAN1]|uniref:4Fe-4S dicluster domain-containing protein n=1 Tax=Methylocystis sp. JAN1 TaxID=3397211 RepID=UPI003FA1E048
MPEATSGAAPLRRVTSVEGLGALIAVLRRRGRRVIGPTIADDAIIYDGVDDLDDLPRGVADAQAPGSYKLSPRDDGALFGYAVGPQSWKKFLHKPLLRLWRAERKGDDVTIEAERPEPQNFAFIGVRACELNAIAIQDRVLMGGDYVDPHYKAQRDGAFIVALNCGQAGGTCFCVSMKAGPKVEKGFDLALTELLSPDAHEFLIEIGSPAGADILAELPSRPATAEDIAAAEDVVAQTAASMGRRMPDEDVPALLMRNLQHPRWSETAQRCLSCANCTMVCPTCFCTSVEDHNDLAGVESSRTRRWDSCFTMDYSYIHGGSVRPSVSSRYRQWMTHKLSTWHEQFGTSGCVGCGRCITWCPVGIDITEETQAISDSEKSAGRP